MSVRARDQSCTLQPQLLSQPLGDLVGECGYAVAVRALSFCQADDALPRVAVGEHPIDLVGGEQALVHQVLADGFEVGYSAGIAQCPDGVSVAEGVGAFVGDTCLTGDVTWILGEAKRKA